MKTSLLQYIRSRGFLGDCLGYILPRMIRHYQEDFRIFADCGGGIGHTSMTYENILRSELSAEAFAGACIKVYEPLPENILELRKRVTEKPTISLREVAVSDFHGKASFTVPRRMTGASASWGEGTSAVGFLGTSSGAETVEVSVIRLEDEAVNQFDFVKLDLQGGERKALSGLGKKLQQAKLVYAEHQLLDSPERQPLDFLSREGYVCYFDKLQFGFKPTIEEVPIQLLKEAGISIERFRLPDTRGMSSGGIFWGSIDITATRHMQADGNFSSEFINRLRDAGAYYVQTDVVAIHQNSHHEVLSLL